MAASRQRSRLQHENTPCGRRRRSAATNWLGNRRTGSVAERRQAELVVFRVWPHNQQKVRKKGQNSLSAQPRSRLIGWWPVQVSSGAEQTSFFFSSF